MRLTEFQSKLAARNEIYFYVVYHWNRTKFSQSMQKITFDCGQFLYSILFLIRCEAAVSGMCVECQVTPCRLCIAEVAEIEIDVIGDNRFGP